MKGLCAECGQDLTQLQSKNGKQHMPLSTATVSMVHSVPELMVSSEQAKQLGREDQQRLHRNRKLVLMVDLDQTLIHTTEQHCQQMSNKGIFHFQLGRGEPMLHTRLRPHCKEFLEKIAKLYELHVFTFGSRLYAHTIAGFLDPEKKLFSHRILSRDECIDPFSKTGNLRNLFPCGDSMVCIIDDREDVWKFAPNLITVKKYVYFQGIGDINAPPGSREMQMKKKANHSSRAAEASEETASPKDAEDDRSAARPEEQSNGLGKPGPELNGSKPVDGDSAGWGPGSRLSDGGAVRSPADPGTGGGSDDRRAAGDPQVPAETRPARGTAAGDLDFELSSDSDSEADGKRSSSSSVSGAEGEERRGWKKPKCPQAGEGRTPPGEAPGGPADAQGVGPVVPEAGERDGLSDLANGCADKREAETESQNSEQSGITVGESLDQSMEEMEEEEGGEEDDEEEDADEDDHLIYLEEILVRVHTDYYAKYDKYLRQEIQEVPDIRKIVPELKSKVLADVTIIFSGLYPTNFPMERTREHYHATALGAKINKNLILSADNPNRATHLIAARAGTEKVRQAQDCKHLHVVNPDWLWSCLERWDKVEEQLFPLKEDYVKTQRVVQPHQQQLFGEEELPANQDGEQPGPSRRKRQPSMSETMPLYTLCKEDLESMDKEVDDILGEGSDESDSEKKKPEEEEEEEEKEKEEERKEEAEATTAATMEEEEKPSTSATETLETKTEPRPCSTSSSDRSLTAGVPRGHKRKRPEADVASESSKESSNEDEEGSSSEADEMAAALEAELNDFM
ncbi:RNA polymerase II subunit A C-terminal domain phosphatase isoform X1 [Ornithorhynchus anatinus]|uniref:RNA polymerase II subunit A C-terminal domain phosphatase isoform X1 n=1 Tax=Ornithorhynchus anatinus TaxID=9258 RepID=UPI0019D45DCD|nr:RNA polymerase II subunit A C-terminal domain phosphatase isoform X1 [Ornithorhynchus anatinus]